MGLLSRRKNASEDSPVALVTGGNRGIGLEICRQLGRRGVRVVLGARDPIKGKNAERALVKEGMHVVSYPLDVTEPDNIRRAALFVESEFGRLDILINNAGILIDRTKNGTNVSVDLLRETLESNVYGPLLLCQAFVPLLKKSREGKIVNLASGQGIFSQMDGGQPAYRISKAGINAVTCILADELREAGIRVNSANPGWTRTDIAGSHASLSVEEGADTIVWLALHPEGGPTGKFFEKRKPRDW
ncbi:MAG: SDR family oxidoreductase [bacterium]|nr:SDR family oxidoreductase [bacterium]